MTIEAGPTQRAKLPPSQARRLRLALRASGAGLGEIDLTTGALDLDDRFRDVFGLGHREELTAEDVFARLVPEDARRLRTRLREVRAGAEPDAFSGEVATEDGVPRFFDLVVEVSERELDGRPRRLVGLVRDVSARVTRLKEVEAERARAELLAEELNHRVRNNFAIMRSVIALSAAEAGSVAEMREDTLFRLSAMAAAHDLSQGGTTATSAHALTQAVLRPYEGGVLVEAEADVLLPGARADALAMALHALTTQSIRRGALGAGGQARVTVRPGHLLWWDAAGTRPGEADLRAALAASRVLNAAARQLGGAVRIAGEGEGEGEGGGEGEEEEGEEDDDDDDDEEKEDEEKDPSW